MIKKFIKNNELILLLLLKEFIIIGYCVLVLFVFYNIEHINKKNKTSNNEIIVNNEIEETNFIEFNNVIETTSRSLENNRTNIKENIAKSKTNTDKPSTNKDGYIKFIATGYCHCKKCCGKTTGITASGAKAKAGVTVAMPKNYKFGTKIEIKGMGTYIVQDRGGAIKNKRIDIFFNTHSEALKFGRKTVYLKVIN